ncbi:MAG: M20/M25/M40 family metallo-hydrolase [Kineosporiaceae bacterium]
MATLLAGALTLGAVTVPAAQARDHLDSTPLRKAITTQGVFRHMQALDDIATANGGERASGTPGYQASVDYIVDQLLPLGYDMTIQPFQFLYFDELTPAEFQQVSPEAKDYVGNEDFAIMTYSGSGDVTAPVQGVDLLLPPTGGSTSGCEAEDFAGFTSGNVALVQRGTCTFLQKAQNAQAAGAAAVVIFNEGNDEARVDLLTGTLGEPGIEIPVIGTSFAVGQELADSSATGETVVRVKTDSVTETRVTYNVFADTPTGRENRRVIAGAHLDSVADSPGMNDNASGTAALLETAIQWSALGIEPRNQVRFAFWGAEELGLLGAEYYVQNLSEREREQIGIYLNFDVLASINGYPFVYTPTEGDGSPARSAEAAQVFHDYFDAVNLPADPTPLLPGASDHVAFLEAGIPAGGLFSGATEIKTEAQAEAYGGTAGEPFDELINSPFDTIDRVNRPVLINMSDAAAHGIFVFAFDRFRQPTMETADVQVGTLATTDEPAVDSWTTQLPDS